ncbi:RodZ domain-containing protein [Shewanella sp. GXUN23E]|uniref:RodZ domain-containing protein n=1 Tax=Shewanella sp. GXUN23E TaxID=3422498 RepID=UPI003D7DBD93
MTDKQQDLITEDTVEQESRDITATVGGILQAAREAKGLTIDDIAGRLHLRPSLVRDIEADKFDGISSATYARGYVRNYARIVGADVSEVMACLAQQVPSEAEPAMQSFSRKTTHQARDSRLMMVTWLIAIVLAALLVLWWVQKSTMSTGIDLSRPSAEEVAAAVELGATAAGEPVVDTAALADAPADMPADVMVEETAVPAAIEPTTDASSSNPPLSADKQPAEPSETATASTADAADASLKLSLSGDCWMKVTDATGKVLINGVKEAGRSITVNGTAPFNLVVGAPQVVTLQYNGENVSLADYPAGKVARFSLPLE